MKIGYALAPPGCAVPLGDQIAALRDDDCASVFRDGPDAGPDRPGLLSALCAVHTGDVLVFFDVTALGRTAEELAWIVRTLALRRVGLKTLHGGIDPPPGRPRFARLLAVMQAHGDAA